MAVLSRVSFSFDEDLWFGATDDARAERAAVSSMAASVGRILGAKPFPEAAKQLAALTHSEDAELDPAVRVLESDPGLSAQLLKLVNSAGYALRFRCSSVRHAAALVGMDQLHQVASAAAILGMFDSPSPQAVAVLRHGASVGAICRYLGAHFALSAEELFTIGFLHELGKLMQLETEGERYAALLDAHGEDEDALLTAERETYGFDHAVLAAHVLAAWAVPDPVPQIVAWHRNVARAYAAGGRYPSLVHVLRLAKLLSSALGSGDRERLQQVASSESAQWLDISEAQLGAMWRDLRRLHARATNVEAEPESDVVLAEPRLSRSPPERISKTAELPIQLPCVVCSAPSFGNRCPACEGHVCPEHQVGAGGWCIDCARALREHERDRGVRQRRVVAGAWLALSGLGLVALGADVADRPLWGAVSVLIAGASLSVLVALVGGVALRGLSVRRFLAARPKRRSGAMPSPLDARASWVAESEPTPVPAPLSELSPVLPIVVEHDPVIHLRTSVPTPSLLPYIEPAGAGSVHPASAPSASSPADEEAELAREPSKTPALRAMPPPAAELPVAAAEPPPHLPGESARAEAACERTHLARACCRVLGGDLGCSVDVAGCSPRAGGVRVDDAPAPPAELGYRRIGAAPTLTVPQHWRGARRIAPKRRLRSPNAA